MSTTVIVIRGNSSQSLLNRIASALKDEEENELHLKQAKKVKKELINAFSALQARQEKVVVEQPSLPVQPKMRKKYNIAYKFDENQEKLVKQFLVKNPTFNFHTLRKFLLSAGYSTVYNRDLVVCLSKLNVVRVKTENNKRVWSVQNRTK